MDNGQFTIPGTPELSNNEQIRRDVDAIFDGPERQAPSFARYKQVERDIEAMRSSMTEADLPRSVKMRVLELFTSTPRSLEERLIEEESRIGGELFAQDPSVTAQRYWLHQGEWFHERYYDSAAEADSRVVIRYQLTNDSAHKLVKGVEHSFDDGEIQRLLQAIDSYYTRVQRELYTKKDDYGLAA